MNSLTFFVFGLPIAQGSMRSVGNGRIISNNDITLKTWRQDIAVAANACLPPDWDPSLPVAISVVFRFKRPKGHIGKRGLKPAAPQHHTKAPDVDKLARALNDGLSVTASVIDNDSQVTTLAASKRYCVGDEPAGALVTITPIA